MQKPKSMQQRLRLLNKLMENWYLRNVLTTIALIAAGIIGTVHGWEVVRSPATHAWRMVVYITVGVLFDLVAPVIIIRFWTVRPVRTGHHDATQRVTIPLHSRRPIDDPDWKHQVNLDSGNVMARLPSQLKH